MRRRGALNVEVCPMDLMFVGLTFVLFALTLGLVRLCEKV